MSQQTADDQTADATRMGAADLIPTIPLAAATPSAGGS
jgi:glutamate formiminotransferase